MSVDANFSEKMFPYSRAQSVNLRKHSLSAYNSLELDAQNQLIRYGDRQYRATQTAFVELLQHVKDTKKELTSHRDCVLGFDVRFRLLAT